MIEEKNKTPFVYPTLEDVERLVQALMAKEDSDPDGEPMPSFQTRYPNKLESILGQIEAEYFGEPLFPDLTSKAARLFYGIAGQHPFLNGNKRTAILALVEFLRTNPAQIPVQKILLFSDDALFEMAIRVGQATAEQEDEIMNYLKEKIDGMFVDISEFDE